MRSYLNIAAKVGIMTNSTNLFDYQEKEHEEEKSIFSSKHQQTKRNSLVSGNVTNKQV